MTQIVNTPRGTYRILIRSEVSVFAGLRDVVYVWRRASFLWLFPYWQYLGCYACNEPGWRGTEQSFREMEAAVWA